MCPIDIMNSHKGKIIKNFSFEDKILINEETFVSQGIVDNSHVTVTYKYEQKYVDSYIHWYKHILVASKDIEHVNLQVPELCQIAIDKNPFNIKYVKDQSQDLCRLAVSKNYKSIIDIRNPDIDICRLAIDSCPDAIKIVPLVDFDILESVLNRRGRLLEYISCHDFFSALPSEAKNSLYKTALKNDGMSLQFVDDATDDLCQIAIINNPWAIVFIKNPNINMVMYVIERNGLILEVIEDQNAEICMKAVEQCGWAIKFVKQKIKENLKIWNEIKILAIKNCVRCLGIIDDQSEELCNLALSIDPSIEHMIHKDNSDKYKILTWRH